MEQSDLSKVLRPWVWGLFLYQIQSLGFSINIVSDMSMIDDNINNHDDNNDLYCRSCDKLKLYEKITIITMRTIINSIAQDSKGH